LHQIEAEKMSKKVDESKKGQAGKEQTIRAFFWTSASSREFFW